MMKKTMKPTKGTIPAGYANGGKVMPFKGKEGKAEEMAEAKAVRGGKMTPKQYAASEKKEGDKQSTGKLMATGKALASGKMSGAKYSASQKMANGGMVKGSMKKGC